MGGKKRIIGYALNLCVRAIADGKPVSVFPGLALALGLTAMGMAAPAFADAHCDMLVAELQRTQAFLGNPADARKLASAIARQNFEIRKSQQNMMRLGCSGSVSVLDSEGRDVCANLQSATEAMQAAVNQLQTQKQGVLTNSGPNPHYRDIQAEIVRSGCDAIAPTSEPISAPVDDDARVRPYSMPDAALEGDAQNSLPQATVLPSGQGGEKFRTMCVRTCDGAFFPISAFATEQSFATDAAQCQRQCPGAETELYYHKMLSEETSDMVAYKTGKLYRDMSFAFAYRNRAVGEKSQCSCALLPQQTQNQSVPMQKIGSTNPDMTNIGLLPLRGQTNDGQKPAGANQHNDGSQSQAITAASFAQPVPAPERNYEAGTAIVRQVGPAFLPDEVGK